MRRVRVPAVNGRSGRWPRGLMLSQKVAAYSDSGRGCKHGLAVQIPMAKGDKAMILPITLTIAGATAILHVWLSLQVSRLRRPLKIGVGDGGNEVLMRRMRAHGNFAENVPIFLVLLGFLELATGGDLWLWGAAILFVLAEILHVFGMDRTGANPMRVIGISVSWLVLLGLGLYAIFIAYQSPPIQRGFQLSPGRSAEAARPLT